MNSKFHGQLTADDGITAGMSFTEEEIEAPNVDVIRARVRKPLGVAAMILGAVTVPFLFREVFSRPDPTPTCSVGFFGDIVVRPDPPAWWLWHIPVGLLAGLLWRGAMLRICDNGGMFWRSLIASALSCILATAGATFMGPLEEKITFSSLGLTTALFAVALVGICRLAPHRDTVFSHESPPAAALSSAGVLAIAAVMMQLAVWRWETPDARDLALAGLNLVLAGARGDAVLFPGLWLGIPALVLFLWGSAERRRMMAIRSEILSGEHLDYVLGDGAPTADSLPLMECDREGAGRAVMRRRDAAYRQVLAGTHIVPQSERPPEARPDSTPTSQHE